MNDSPRADSLIRRGTTSASRAKTSSAAPSRTGTASSTTKRSGAPSTARSTTSTPARHSPTPPSPNPLPNTLPHGPRTHSPPPHGRRTHPPPTPRSPNPLPSPGQVRLPRRVQPLAVGEPADTGAVSRRDAARAAVWLRAASLHTCRAVWTGGLHGVQLLPLRVRRARLRAGVRAREPGVPDHVCGAQPGDSATTRDQRLFTPPAVNRWEAQFGDFANTAHLPTSPHISPYLPAPRRRVCTVDPLLVDCELTPGSLRFKGAVHDRPVHLERRAKVAAPGRPLSPHLPTPPHTSPHISPHLPTPPHTSPHLPAGRPRDDAASRLRGAGPGALLGPPRALPPDVRRRRGAGRCGEMRGDAGRCGEMRGDAGRCGEMCEDDDDAARRTKSALASLAMAQSVW